MRAPIRLPPKRTGIPGLMPVEFNPQSKARLAQVDPRLAELMLRVEAQHPNAFEITEGIRDPQRQAQMVAEGKSKTLNSRHLTGNAVDIAMIGPDGKPNWTFEDYQPIAATAKATAASLGIPDFVWGGDWKTLRDAVHFQVGGPQQGGPTNNLTVSSKGGTGMGLLDMPAEQPRTLMDRIRSPETVDNLLSWVNSMRLNPDPNIGGMIENRQARRAEADVANRTAQWLRSQGREDLAGAVESGTLGGREAASIFYQPAEAQGQVVTAEQLRAMYPGTQIEEGIYSQKPDGTISKVGGAGGPIVNVNTGGGKFEEGFAKADAELLGSVYASGLQATRNLGRIDQLGTLLQSAPTGAEGAFKLAAGEFGIATEGLDDAQAAQALINSLVPEQRQPGSGPMSDADLALFKQSLPRIVNQPGGNALILDTMRAIAQYDAQGAQIVQMLRSNQIDRPTAFQMLQERPNPLGSFKAPAGATGGGATGTDITEDDLRWLEGN